MGMKYTNNAEMYEIIEARHRDPHHILGMHEIEVHGEKWMIVRTFCNVAQKVYVVDRMDEEKTYEMTKIHDHGFFEVVMKDRSEFFEYKLKYEGYDQHVWENFDPYSFWPVLSDMDLYLFGQGTNYKLYEKLGANLMEVGGVRGTLFAVWAPNATRVSVVGSFNDWDGRRHPMRNRGSSGVWELFIPGIGEYDQYKYEIKTKTNDVLVKSDPYGFYFEFRPNTANIVFNMNKYQWNDQAWYDGLRDKDVYNMPLNIYEVHLGSWARGENNSFLGYRDLAERLGEYVKEMGYTHIELLPITEHPFDLSWGYQVTGYYAPTSRFGNPDDFMYFVDHMHSLGIGVLIDWVPAHFPKDSFALARFDGTCLYEHQDPRQGEHPDWGTLIFNFGRNEVKNFLIANALYWIEKFHIDGLRVDAVASMIYLDYGKKYGEWVPNPYGGKENIEAIEFVKHMNSVVGGYYPKTLLIAEESTAWSNVSRRTEDGGLGFKFKWNMGWMNDFLHYMNKEAVYRKYHHNNLTFGLIYAFSENFILVLSHDEVVYGKGSMIGKMPGDYWQKFANLRVAYGFMYGHPGKKLLFMGGEFGQFNEWDCTKSLDWNLLDYDMHRDLKEYMKDLNYLYRNENALWANDFGYQGFEWIDCQDANASILAFFRKGINPDEYIYVVCNFTPVPHYQYKLALPFEGSYVEIFNSDDVKYGGSGIVNPEPVKAIKKEYFARPYYAEIKLPPLGVTYFKLKTW